MASPQDFRNATKRELALVFADQPRTLYEASKALGRPVGSIAPAARRMVAERLLIADPDPPVRGTMYSIEPTARTALEEALRQQQPVGLLQEYQQLLIVTPGDDPIPLLRVLARPLFSAVVAWRAELNGGTQLLLAMAPGASADDVNRLAIAITTTGGMCVRQQIGQLGDSDTMRRGSAALIETVEALV